MENENYSPNFLTELPENVWSHCQEGYDWSLYRLGVAARHEECYEAADPNSSLQSLVLVLGLLSSAPVHQFHFFINVLHFLL